MLFKDREILRQGVARVGAQGRLVQVEINHRRSRGLPYSPCRAGKAPPPVWSLATPASALPSSPAFWAGIRSTKKPESPSRPAELFSNSWRTSVLKLLGVVYKIFPLYWPCGKAKGKAVTQEIALLALKTPVYFVHEPQRITDRKEAGNHSPCGPLWGRQPSGFRFSGARRRWPGKRCRPARGCRAKTSPLFPAGFQESLETLLKKRVDVVTPGALHWYIKDRVLREARPL